VGKNALLPTQSTISRVGKPESRGGGRVKTNLRFRADSFLVHPLKKTGGRACNHILQMLHVNKLQLTSDPLPSSISVELQLNNLTPVTAEEVTRLLSKTDKSSALDFSLPDCIRGSQIHCHRWLQNWQTSHSRWGHSQLSSNMHRSHRYWKKPASRQTTQPVTDLFLSSTRFLRSLKGWYWHGLRPTYLAPLAKMSIAASLRMYVPRRSTETSLPSLFDDLHALND